MINVNEEKGNIYISILLMLASLSIAFSVALSLNTKRNQIESALILSKNLDTLTNSFYNYYLMNFSFPLRVDPVRGDELYPYSGISSYEYIRRTSEGYNVVILSRIDGRIKSYINKIYPYVIKDKLIAPIPDNDIPLYKAVKSVKLKKNLITGKFQDISISSTTLSDTGIIINTSSWTNISYIDEFGNMRTGLGVKIYATWTMNLYYKFSVKKFTDDDLKPTDFKICQFYPQGPCKIEITSLISIGDDLPSVKNTAIVDFKDLGYGFRNPDNAIVNTYTFIYKGIRITHNFRVYWCKVRKQLRGYIESLTEPPDYWGRKPGNWLSGGRSRNVYAAVINVRYIEQ